MIRDGLIILSDLASGDAPRSVTDNAGANYVDQQAGGIVGLSGRSGMHGDFFFHAKVTTQFTSGGLATLQAVLQDSSDNSSWNDRVLGDAIAVASLTAHKELAKRKIPQDLRQYVRVVWRVGVAVMTAGVAMAWLGPEADTEDNRTRGDGVTVTMPSGAADFSAAQGLLGR